MGQSVVLPAEHVTSSRRQTNDSGRKIAYFSTWTLVII